MANEIEIEIEYVRNKNANIVYRTEVYRISICFVDNKTFLKIKRKQYVNIIC